MSATKPSFVLVPGAWCPGFYYHKVVASLQAKGYDALAIDLPSVGRKEENPPATAYDDASHVRSATEEILNAGKNAIIVGNSYGCFVTCEAAKGLSKAARSTAGKAGGAVTSLILTDFLLPPKGATVNEILNGLIPVDTSAMDPTDPYASPQGDASMGYKALFGSLDEEEGLYYANMVQPHSALSFLDPLTYAAYEDIPTTVVIGENDVALSPELQENAVDAGIERGVRGLKKVILKGGDHVPAVSHPEELVKICVEVAEHIE